MHRLLLVICQSTVVFVVYICLCPCAPFIPMGISSSLPYIMEHRSPWIIRPTQFWNVYFLKTYHFWTKLIRFYRRLAFFWLCWCVTQKSYHDLLESSEMGTFDMFRVLCSMMYGRQWYRQFCNFDPAGGWVKLCDAHKVNYRYVFTFEGILSY